MKNEKIKSCPFCGSNRVDVMKVACGAYYIRCENDDCQCETNTSPTREAAVTTWNQRRPNNRATVVIYDMDLPEAERIERYQKLTDQAA